MSTILTILLLLILIGAIVLLSIFYSLFFGLLFSAPWVPLRQKDVKRMLNLAEIKSDDVLYDLGSGDGRVIITAAKKYKIKTVGIEIAWPLTIWSKLKTKFFKCDKLVKVKCSNFLRENLSEATIVVCYLMPEALEKLISKFKTELRPKTKIISAGFKINDWPVLKIDRPKSKDIAIYFYQI